MNYKTQVTAEQAEAVHQCGGDVWYRFKHWPGDEFRSALHCHEASPYKLSKEYPVEGGKWPIVGEPFFYVEAE